MGRWRRVKESRKCKGYVLRNENGVLAVLDVGLQRARIVLNACAELWKV